MLHQRTVERVRDEIRGTGDTPWYRAASLFSHVLEVVECVCTRVIVIHHGKIMADDSVSRLRELMNLSSLEEIFRELVEQRDLESVAKQIVAAIGTGHV